MPIKFRNTLLVPLIAITSACSVKQGEPEERPSTKSSEISPQATPKEAMTETLKEKSMSPGIQSRRLQNGMEIYTLRKTDIPMITVLIAARNGAFVETPETDGLAHLYEHMFFKANETVPSQPEFMRALDQLGVQLGPNMNAYTSTESVRYFFTIQSAFLERGMNFMANALKTPKFLEDELEKEREVVIGEFDRYEASPTQVFYQRDILGRLFAQHFYAKNVIGNREVILAATSDQMREIQRQFYIPNNTALFIVGDFDEKQLQTIIDKEFGNWQGGENPLEVRPPVEHPPLTETQIFTQTGPVQNAQAVVAFQGPSLSIDDSAIISFDLLSTMVGFETSEFQKQLVHSGLASSASFISWSQRFTSPLFFHLETTPEKAEAAYNKMRSLISALANGELFSERDFNTAKTAIEVRSAYDREVGQRFALGLASVWTSTGSLEFYTEYIPRMKALSFAEFRRALSQYLGNTHYVGGALLPHGSEALQLESAMRSQP